MAFGRIVLGLFALLGAALAAGLLVWLGTEAVHSRGSAGVAILWLVVWLLAVLPAPLLASAINLLFRGREKADGAEMYFLLGAVLCVGQSVFAIHIGWDYFSNMWGVRVPALAFLAWIPVLVGAASAFVLARKVTI